MKGLVIEKNDFSKNVTRKDEKGNDVIVKEYYYILKLSISGKDGVIRICMNPPDFKQIKAWFVKKNLYDSVSVGKVYNFQFVADPTTGATSIGKAEESSF